MYIEHLPFAGVFRNSSFQSLPVKEFLEKIRNAIPSGQIKFSLSQFCMRSTYNFMTEGQVCTENAPSKPMQCSPT